MITLWFTDHALRRYVELMPLFDGHLPKHVSHVLDLDGAKKLASVFKAVMRELPLSMRVVLPPNKQWGKFMRHGIQDSVLYCSKTWLTYVILKEKMDHTVVTISRPPKNKRDAEVDYGSGINPSGLDYLKDVSRIVLPYTLKAGLKYDIISRPMRYLEFPVYFGKVNDEAAVAKPDEPK